MPHICLSFIIIDERRKRDGTEVVIDQQLLSLPHLPLPA
jgi:hypothetical protein